MSFDDGFILGLSLGGGGSGGTVGKLKAIVDDGATNLSVILTDNSTLAEYAYTYIAKTITASVTTSVTAGETTTTSTKSWSKYLIDKLYDVSGELVAQAVYSDEANGVVSHYIDSNNNIIYIDGGYTTEGLETGAAVIGADVNAVAIAYAIARNQESAAALQELKKAYRDGTVNGDNGNDDVTEPYKTTDPDKPMPFPDDGESTVNTDDAITDLTKGYWFACGDRDTETVKYYVKVWIEPYLYQSSVTDLTQRNKIYAAVFDTDGNQFGSNTYCDYQYYRSVYGIETAIRAQLVSKSLLIWRYITDLDGTPSDPAEQATVYQLTNATLGAIVWSGNVNPFN
ncbi:MAG: hypothetical protein ACI4Q4_03415 [Oscillospiraceae bacterium]